MIQEYSSRELLAKYLQEDAIELYLDEVARANRRFNLFSSSMSRDDLRRLIAESLIPLERGWIDGGGLALDIGSGWGIPSVPLQMALPEFRVSLMERSEKKAGFLSYLHHRLGSLEPPSYRKVLNLDLESYHPEEPFDLIILRQVAVDDRLWGHIRRVASPDASFIYFGSRIPDQLKSSARIVSYSIDGSSERVIIKAKIF